MKRSEVVKRLREGWERAEFKVVPSLGRSCWEIQLRLPLGTIDLVDVLKAKERGGETRYFEDLSGDFMQDLDEALKLLEWETERSGS